MISEDEKKRIIEILSNRLLKNGRANQCPMCLHNSFTISDGYFSNAIQADLKTLTLGGTSVPTIALICNNCGFVSQHALGILGLLPVKEVADVK